MKISSTGLDLIKLFEGFRSKAYLCPAGILTVGYGSTGKHVTRGMVVSEPQATALLIQDAGRFEKAVNALKITLTQNQFDALVSLAFNIGSGNFNKSTLVRKLKVGDMAGAAAQFAVWNKATVNGRLTVLPGLVRRRAAETALFNRP
jgi:lysozyme